MLYHGSPHRIKKFKPKPHFLAKGKAVVFGTPIIEIAFASMQPWTDDDFEQGIVDNEPPFMIEQYPGAFEEIYGGKQGYLYEVANDTFFTNENLTRFELVSYESPTILARHKFDNVLSLLEATELQMIKYEDGDSFRKKGIDNENR